MASITIGILHLLVVLVTTLSLCDFTEANRRPQIFSKFETVVSPGDDFNVTCAGNTPLTWTTPEVPEEYRIWTKIHVRDKLPMDENFKYASMLVVENASFPFTGFYSCHNKDVSSSDDSQSSRIYLFVRDEEHLAVSLGEVETILATQYDTAVIPCRPTSPDVTVDLTLITGEKIENATYDPKTGFSFYVDHLSYEGSYLCLFSRGGVEFETFPYLKVSPVTNSIAKPIVEEVSGGHTVVGQTLVVACKVRTPVQVNFEWFTPTGPPNLSRMAISDLKKDPADSGIIVEKLTIDRTKSGDEGVYRCTVSDNQNHYSSNSINVKVFGENEHFIELMEENDVYVISEMAGAPVVRWNINVMAHPVPKVYWLNNHNETIPSGTTNKYSTKATSKVAVLEIKDVTIADFGNYTLVAQNDFETKTLNLFLNVTDKPSVHIESKDFHFIDKPSKITCLAAASPRPTIRWWFKACQEPGCYFQPLNETRSESSGLQVTSYAHVTASQSGYIKCNASNSIGRDEAIQGFYVSDVEDGLDIFGLDSTIDVNPKTNQAVVAEGETIAMTCGASVHNYTDGIQWYHDATPLQTDNRYTVEKSRTEYSNRVALKVPQVSVLDGGVYSCRVPTRDGEFVYENMTVVVSEPTMPVINDTNLDKDIVMELPKPLQLYCVIWGIPKPTISWYKNDEELVLPHERLLAKDRNQRLVFPYTDAKDEGTYRCMASNRMGRATRQMILEFTNKPPEFALWLYPTLAGLALMLVVSCIIIMIKIKKERKLDRELKKLGLANFEKGAIENLNPELGIDDQAELLPYDKKWEFPIEKLKLGKQLGSGAFGVVMKGEARGIVDGEDTTTVAVKMVKKNADHIFIKALASELKIMVHLGQHLNVVNLLGACTKNVAKRELLVIVEFCRFGNLHNYLLRHRDNFIDQVDPKTGRIDYVIGQDLLERTYSVSSSRSNPQSPYLKYAALAFAGTNSNGGQVPTEMADYRGKNYSGTTARTETTTVSMDPNSGEEGMVISNNSMQPEWRSNYKGDYKGTVKPICTKDLLLWAFQVSRGMEYLASRKVMHGDLAARNILLADNNVVKICDFGLAKSMYKNDNYKKRGDGPLPVKWMAIESIRDRVFSTQSDVWSFGIVLWEFFSLARTPYPGMEADERLYNKLVDGYRMESPDFAPKEVYKMMLDCWRPKPLTRPTFTRLEERIGSMLEDSVRKHYIDLNDPYLVMNTQRIEGGHDDYLAMVSPPNFENLSTPHHYVNDLGPPSEETPGYLCMKPQTIFSPRPDDEGRIFDFEVSKKKDKTPVEATKTELLPMLAMVSADSDCDSSACNSPTSPPTSFSNPSYHLPPVIERGEREEAEDKDIVKSADNYVNMPQNKTALKESNNNFSKKNPFIGEDVGKAVHYVNSHSRDWESVDV